MSRRHRGSRRALGLLLVSALATAACGSTVQQTASDAVVGGAVGAPQLGGDGLSAPDPTGPDGTTTTTGSEALAGAGGTVTSGGGTVTTGGTGSGATVPDGGPSTAGTSGGGSSTTATSTGGAMGPGVTAKTIALGIPYCSDCSAANAAIGADGEDPGDTRRYHQAALDEVNSRGGVLGRKLVAVFHQTSASQNVDASQQEACETFTKDNKVAAIFMRGEIIFECAKQAGIIAVGQGGSGALFARFPNLFSPMSIRLERLAAVTVRGMVAAGWHKPDATWPTGQIGIITWESNDYEFAIDKGWLPALKAAGLKAKDVRYVAVPQSDKSLADSSSAISAAVLSFRQQGIDHVFIADGPAGIFFGGGLTLQFLNNAKSQGYYPRYGFNANNAPGDPNLPADQQVGMIAVDSSDFQKANDQGISPNPQRERCFALMKKNNLTATDGRATGNFAVGVCDTAWFTEAVFKRATSGTMLPRVIAAAESLGTSYRTPYSYGTRIGSGQHDGVSFFRNAKFDEPCSCMKYTSKPYEP
jgi:hypothetical protein